MIKFFSRIRKKLAAENKVAPYLRYAIGEIVLVVIGILIAIQANNWNIDKIAQRDKEFALHKLIVNLNQDKSNLQFSIEQGKSYISTLDSCLIILKNPNAYSKEYFAELFYNINYTLSFEFNRISFNDISNSGKLKLIKKVELTDSLIHYYDEGSFKPVEEAINNHTRENIRSYTMGYDFLLMRHDIDKNLASEFNIETKSLLEYSSDVRIINLIRFKILLFTNLIERYDQLNNKAGYLITLINKELKDN